MQSAINTAGKPMPMPTPRAIVLEWLLFELGARVDAELLTFGRRLVLEDVMSVGKPWSKDELLVSTGIDVVGEPLREVELLVSAGNGAVEAGEIGTSCQFELQPNGKKSLLLCTYLSDVWLPDILTACNLAAHSL